MRIAKSPRLANDIVHAVYGVLVGKRKQREKMRAERKETKSKRNRNEKKPRGTGRGTERNRLIHFA